MLIAAVPGASAAERSFVTRAQALAEAFPGARLEQKSYVLTPAQARALEERSRVRLTSKLVSAALAWRGDTLTGTAFFDSRLVRTMTGVFMVVVAPDTTVERVEVLAFHEPPEYRPSERWLSQFRRRRLDDRLWPRADIRNLSGATLSSRTLTESARLALACYELLVAPALARAPAVAR
jgi:hypothetical protein